jgi:hypothetical protein
MKGSSRRSFSLSRPSSSDNSYIKHGHSHINKDIPALYMDIPTENKGIIAEHMDIPA